MTSINGHDPIGGILKLQLKKPEHWKWELSTSKSSPHIALPLVQLFDQNGELLIETDNKNSNCRRSWHCDDLKNTSPTEILINFYKSKLPKDLWKSTIKDLQNGCKKSNTVDFASLQKPKVQRQPSMIPVDENDTINFDKKNEETNFPRKKYKLRTCNAGTLVVSDDSFEMKPRIRRPKKHEGLQNGVGTTADLETNHTSTNIDDSKKNVRNVKNKMESKGPKYSKSDLGIYSSEYKPVNNVLSRHTSDSNLKDIGQKGGDTQIVQIMDLYDEERRSNKPKLCMNNNKIKDTNADGNKTDLTRNYNECGYFVQEPITPGSDCRRPSFPIVSPSRRTRRRNHIRIRRTSEDTSSSGAVPLDATRKRKLKRRKKRKGDRVLEIDRQPVAGVEDATRTLQNAPDAILLRLVRSLASVNHDGVVPAPVANAPLSTTRCSSGPSRPCDLNASRLCQVEAEMGANVSRHSGKGLSGRRTQSSGNICNGKTTNVAKLLGPCAARSNSGVKERKRFCGSLPNHLDGGDDDSYDYDTESVCYSKENNNHVEVVQQAVKAPPQVPPKPASRFPSSAGHYKKVEPDLVDVELKLQPFGVGPVGGHPTSDAALLCDQGYGSERSPEDENPPPLPMMPAPSSESGADDDSDPSSKYSFITPEATFTVSLTKGLRGLGLSVCGGRDSDSSLPGLVRIKRLFPNQPAAQCGLLAPGDVLLAANGQPLTGLTNYEALEVLRTTPNNVVLTICRPPSDVLSAVSPLSEVPPPPPRRDPPCTLNLLPPLAPLEEPYCGEFDIILTKVQGSLGFTLRKEDESALGHYVRALVREPALSDGRIKPGDKIVAVNDVELSPFSHEQAVQFLRQCGNEVKLRLYRDAAQTPVAALSPTEPDPPQRLRLRQEAMDMLSDLAVRKLSPNGGPPGDIGWGTSGVRRSISPPVGSPRRLRRTQRSTPDTDCGSTCTDDLGSSNKYVLSSQVTSESDSFSRKASIGSENTSTPNFSSIESEPEKPIRPNFLNLCSPAVTPTSRKPKFQFSIAHNAYELNNLDADVLDAPNLTYTLNRNDSADNDNDYHDPNNAMMSEEPASMPPISSAGFSYKNPAYQSAHPQCGSDNVDSNVDKKSSGNEEGTKGLLKWKGVVFTPEGSVDENATDKKPKDNSVNTSCDSEIEILNVELNRGWNSRLGFSLQQGEGNTTFISAVHADSVAAKDGRLKAGDRLLRVNDEDIDGMSTNSVIDLLRIVRGPISIIVARKK